MDLGLAGKVFVVTAASGGLGRAAAEALVGEGAHVVLVARRPEPLDAAVAALGPAAAGLAADVTEPETARRAVELALERFGRLDGALVSVGGPPRGTVLETTEDVWRDAFASVVLPALRVAREVVAAASGPVALAFVLSTSAKEPLAVMAPSNVTRPGLAMVLKQMADEVGPSGSRVVGLMPGTIQTDRIEFITSQADDPAAALAQMGASAALRRVGQPAEFGRVAAFVLSDAASFLTGCMIPVDGGRLRGL